MDSAVGLRDRMQILRSTTSLGSVPEFSAGAITGGNRTVKTSDPLDLGRWLAQYETSSSRTRSVKGHITSQDKLCPSRTFFTSNTYRWRV